jgi:hypothetical protein
MKEFIAAGLYVKREGNNLSVRVEANGKWLCTLIDNDRARDLATFIEMETCAHEWISARVTSVLDAAEYTTFCAKCGKEDDGDG